MKLLSEHLLANHELYIGEDRGIPERNIAMNNPKTPRILNGMCHEYSVILHYLKPGDHVLDLCAGGGLGTQMLVNSGYKVTAIDRRIDCLEQRHGIHEIIKMNVLSRSIPGTYDACAFNEAIEHFHLKHQHMLLKEIGRVTKGYVCIGTPLSRTAGPKNRHHLYEHTWDSFGEIVSQHFTIHKRFTLDWHRGQFFALIEGQQEASREAGQIIIARGR